MTANTPQQLIELLQNLEDISKQFNALLISEKEALKAPDSEKLLALSSLKKDLALRLEKSTKTTHVFLNSINIHKGLYGLNHFIKGLKPSHIERKISQLWQNIQDLSDDNQQLNDLNGSIIELNKRYTQRSLDVLRGQVGSSASATYGADGQAMKSKLSRNITIA